MVTIYPDRGGIGKDAVWPSLSALNSSSYTGGGPGSRAWYLDAGVRREAEYVAARGWVPVVLPKDMVVCAQAGQMGLTASVLSSGSASIDSRKCVTLATDISHPIRLLYQAVRPLGDRVEETAANSNDASVYAAIELETGVVNATFKGSRRGTLTPFGFLLSDPINIGKRAQGYSFYVRDRAEYSAAGVLLLRSGYRQDEGSADDRASLVGGSGTTGYSADKSKYLFAPTAIIEDRVNTTGKYTLFVGDSITYGSSDEGLTETGKVTVWGWPSRYLRGHCGGMIAGYPGGGAGQFTIHNVTNLLSVASLLQFDRVVFSFGANDVLGKTFAQMKTDFAAMVNLAKTIGIYDVRAALILPRTTSTDSWTTIENQTPQNGFAPGGVRDQMNAWYLSGADGLITGTVDTLSQVAIGSAWIPGKTGDGAHPNTSGYASIATTAAVALG